ncbi:cellulose binding domain-containing protein [Actinomadura sp. SCN-SB]|uniref:cellulose binding domain-containing protein n=1 Tax=Actinomadura sp. SCN-SB TaxID=3373092 RepID=UPI003751E801
MSGEEPGYVPPDHKDTTEFKIPKLQGAYAGPVQDGDATGPGTVADDTLMDGTAGSGLADTTMQDFPADDPPEEAGPAGATLVDDPGAEAPSTVTDFQADAVPASDDDDPTPPVQGAVPLPPYALAQDEAGTTMVDEPEPTLTDAVQPKPEETPAEAASIETTPEAAPDSVRVAPIPPATPEVPAGPWTEQFGAEEATGRQQAAFEQGAPAAPEAPAGPTEPHQAASPMPSPPLAAPVPPSAGPAGPTAPDAAFSQAPPPPQQAPLVPGMSPSGGLPPTGPIAGTENGRSGRRPLLLIGAVVVLLALGGAAIAFLMAGGDDPRGPVSQSSPPAAQTSPAAPAPAPGGGAGPTGSPAPGGAPDGGPGGAPGSQAPDGGVPEPTAPPIGPVVTGDGITYQLVQRDPGYFEGKLVITNRSREPMRAWRITFTVPDANVKNIWGGRLVRKGEKVEISNLENAPAIQPGATWEIQYGAEGSPVQPEKCRLNGEPCGS